MEWFFLETDPCVYVFCPYSSLDPLTTITEIRIIVWNFSTARFKALYPQELGNLRKLEEMAIRSSIHGMIPPSINLPFPCSELRGPLVDGYLQPQAVIIPPEIGQLKNLKRLFVLQVFIEELPDSIGELKNLNYLYMQYTRLKQIPEAIANLENLNEFEGLKGTFPRSFKKLTGLRSLTLRGALSGSFPKFLLNLPNIRGIDMSNNRLGGPFPTANELSSSSFLKNKTAASRFELPYLVISGNWFYGQMPVELSGSMRLFMEKGTCLELGPGVNTSMLPLDWRGKDSQRPRQACLDSIALAKANGTWIDEPDDEDLFTSSSIISSTSTNRAATTTTSSSIPSSSSSSLPTSGQTTVDSGSSPFQQGPQPLSDNPTLPVTSSPFFQQSKSASLSETLPFKTLLLSSTTQPPVSTETSEESATYPNGLTLGTAVGLGVLTLFLALGIIGAAFWAGKRKRKRLEQTQETESDEPRLVQAVVMVPLPDALEGRQSEPSTGRANMGYWNIAVQESKESKATAGTVIDKGIETEGTKVTLNGSEKETLKVNQATPVDEGSTKVEAPMILLSMETMSVSNCGGSFVLNLPYFATHKWTVDDVQRWLDSVGFRREVCDVFKGNQIQDPSPLFLILFEAHGINGQALLTLTDHELETRLQFSSLNLRMMILNVRNQTLLGGSSAPALSNSSTRGRRAGGGRQHQDAFFVIEPPQYQGDI
ncbi:hypothetical protein HDU67_009797 [Dinochytrium kinnereticum]|nr:hypothetical protein HDU67_009797 [Dinochytrium kinnereticum]